MSHEEKEAQFFKRVFGVSAVIFFISAILLIIGQGLWGEVWENASTAIRENVGLPILFVCISALQVLMYYPVFFLGGEFLQENYKEVR